MARVTSLTLRLVEDRESELVFSFLTLAARMKESGEPIQKALVDEHLTKYWQAWGRSGDLGVVAVRAPDGLPLSCAWVRNLPEGDDGYVAAGIRELAVGTIEPFRGQGIGSRVLGRLIAEARHCCRGLSLSVRAENPAVRLYERLGFQTTSAIVNRVGGQSLTMQLPF